jgi:hypothetical protein
MSLLFSLGTAIAGAVVALEPGGLSIEDEVRRARRRSMEGVYRSDCPPRGRESHGPANGE